jgi:pilus assembly protein Flp/PilA
MLINLNARVKNFIKDSKGITAIEYALIGVAMATVLAVALGSKDGTNGGLTGAMKQSFETISSSITNYVGSNTP